MPYNSKVTIFNGVTYKSGLEAFMAELLTNEGLFEGYENHTFTIQECTILPQSVYSKQNNGKGDYKLRSSKVDVMSYTPDFCGKDFIIETKGFSTDVFRLRFRIFLKHLFDLGDTRNVYIPRTKKCCEETVKLIKQNRSYDK